MGVLQEKLRTTILGISRQVLFFYCPSVEKGWQPPVPSVERKPNVDEVLWPRCLTSILKAYGDEDLHELTSVGSKVTDVAIKKLSRQVSLEAEIAFGTTDAF